MAFYELRQYFVRPGKMDEWVKIMEEEIIPFQVSKGMVICGSFRGETDDSAYFWIRRFNSETEREAQYKAVYETDHWKTKIAPRVPALPGPRKACTSSASCRRRGQRCTRSRRDERWRPSEAANIRLE